MAEAILADIGQKQNLPICVSSAGLKAMVGYPADPIAQALLKEKGLDISRHRARQATSKILLSTDLILTMSTGQQTEIEGSIPSVRGRVHRLGKWSEFDIVDPFKRPRSIFEQSLILIEQCIDDWYRKLWN
jgi:protein-tyrosine phosphatase